MSMVKLRTTLQIGTLLTAIVAPSAGRAELVLLEKAVAASSAFPPVFPPLKLDAVTYPPGAAVEYVTLTDGGVYDNMGVSPTLRPKNRLDYVIVSDGGSPLEWSSSPSESGLGVLYPAIRIMMDQIRGIEFDRLDRVHRAGGTPKPMWFSIRQNLASSAANRMSQDSASSMPPP